MFETHLFFIFNVCFLLYVTVVYIVVSYICTWGSIESFPCYDCTRPPCSQKPDKMRPELSKYVKLEIALAIPNTNYWEKLTDNCSMYQ